MEKISAKLCKRGEKCEVSHYQIDPRLIPRIGEGVLDYSGEYFKVEDVHYDLQNGGVRIWVKAN